jgi:hypothetical protein
VVAVRRGRAGEAGNADEESQRRRGDGRKHLVFHEFVSPLSPPGRFDAARLRRDNPAAPLGCQGGRVQGRDEHPAGKMGEIPSPQGSFHAASAPGAQYGFAHFRSPLMISTNWIGDLNPAHIEMLDGVKYIEDMRKVGQPYAEKFVDMSPFARFCLPLTGIQYDPQRHVYGRADSARTTSYHPIRSTSFKMRIPAQDRRLVLHCKGSDPNVICRDRFAQPFQRRTQQCIRRRRF